MHQPPGTSLRDPNERINRIIYLASLVSDSIQINEYLDPLREFTARRESPNEPLSPSEDAMLTVLESKIRDYLLVKEPLRSFTPETLEQRLYEKVEAPSIIKQLRWLVAGIVAIGVSLAIAAMLLVPLDSLAVRLSVALMAAITTFYVGGVGLLLASLKQFSPALRSIYRSLSVSFAVGCVGVLANIILLLLYQGNTPWQIFWFVNLPIYFSALPLYIESTKMAKLQGIKKTIHPWAGLSIAAGGMVLLALTSQGYVLDPVNGIPPIFAWMTFVFMASAAVVMRRVWRSSSELYKSPTKALLQVYLSTCLGWFAMMFLPFVPVELSPDLSNIGRLIFIGATFSLVRLGYAMNKLSHY